MPEKPLPNYETVPLRSDEIVVMLIQSKQVTLDINTYKQGIKNNLNLMLQLIDFTQSRRHKDLLIFHEFPLTGSSTLWNREEQTRVAIDVPGEETEAICKKAKQYNCYIEFGAKGRLADWPGHFFYLGVIVGPSGKIIHVRWKLRNMPGLGFGTTVYDVLDAYVERYGEDAIFPVARTDIGNLAIMPEIYDPETARCFAMKGTEMLIRYMTLGAGHWGTRPVSFRGGLGDTMRAEFSANCIYNSVYGFFVNNSMNTDDLIQDHGVGRSSIYDYDGRLMAEAISPFQTTVEAIIPIASFRRQHSIPVIAKELYTAAYGKYASKYAPNLFLKKMPDTNKESAEQYSKNARW
jgi:predicted amidohydrolase